MNDTPLFLLNVLMASGVVVLFLSGNVGLALIALFGSALLSLKLNRRRAH